MSEDDNLREIYSQHWQQTRHIGTERLAFTSFYLGFLGVGLAYISQSNGLETLQKCVILVVLLLFSTLGFLLMVRVLMTFWYHYAELQRITPLLYPNEKLDYEEAQARIEKQIRTKESSLWWLNKTYIGLSKMPGKGMPFPVTLIFPSLFLLGFFISLVMLILVFLNPT